MRPIFEALNCNIQWTQETAKEQAALRADKEAVGKFHVGDTEVQNSLIFIRHGTIEDINYDTGKVLVKWHRVTDASGTSIEGMYGMIYGLYNSEWVSARALM